MTPCQHVWHVYRDELKTARDQQGWVQQCRLTQCDVTEMFLLTRPQDTWSLMTVNKLVTYETIFSSRHLPCPFTPTRLFCRLKKCSKCKHSSASCSFQCPFQENTLLLNKQRVRGCKVMQSVVRAREAAFDFICFKFT